jgi:EXLDI family protein
MSSTHPGAASVSASLSKSSGTTATLRQSSASSAVPIALRLPDMATIEMQQRLPKLDDDADVGIEKEFTVQRDGARDLKFRGTLLASAAPECRGQDRWREYRVYRTTNGTYVLSRIGRSVLNDELDRFEVDTWNSEGDPVRMVDGKGGSRERVLEDLLTGFFRFDQLAKQLYAKLNIDTTERLD